MMTFAAIYALATKRNLIIAGCAILLLILIVAGGISSCRTQNTEKKKDELRIGAAAAESAANVLTNQKANIEQGVKQYETNKNTAVNNFNNAVRRDSNSYQSTDA
jgi:hypothetical protein